MGRVEQRIANHEASVGVIGLGYVGLPLSLAFVDAGFDVRGFDIDHDRIERLQAEDSYVDDVSDSQLSAGIDNGFTPAVTPEIVADCDVYIIAVPTDFLNGGPEMSAIKAAADTVAEQAGKRETLVIVSSTVYPGATSEVVAPIITADRATGSTLFAMVPERLNPGGDHTISEIPLVVGADDPASRDAAKTLFDSISETVPVDTTKTAELSKTIENTYRMVNIALVNELASLSDVIGADVCEAIDAANTKPFGFQAFYPGPGVGGHCIPVDPQFLSWRASEADETTALIDQANAINESMPDKVVAELQTALRARNVEPKDASIIILGASYKPNVADIRNSPAVDVANKVAEFATITVVDPHVDDATIDLTVQSTVNTNELRTADAVVLLVDHDAFDLNSVGKYAPFIYDTRNAIPNNVDATVVRFTDGTSQSPTKLIQGTYND